MKLGFVDCVTNKADVFDPFTKMSEEVMAGVTIERMTAPDVLKVPLCSKKLITAGCDSVVVFLTLSEDDIDAMALVHEKTIDLEIVTEKFILFCVVPDSFEDNSQFEAAVEARFRTVLELVSHLELSPSQVSGLVGDSKMAAELAALSDFATMQAQDESLPGGESETAGQTGEDSKSLF